MYRTLSLILLGTTEQQEACGRMRKHQRTTFSESRVLERQDGEETEFEAGLPQLISPVKGVVNTQTIYCL